MNPDLKFRALGSDQIAVGLEKGDKRGVLRLQADPSESHLYDQLAANIASPQNQTDFLDAFYSAAKNTEMDWTVKLGQNPSLISDESINLQPGTAHLLDLLFDYRSSWDNFSAEISEDDDYNLLEPEYQGPEEVQIEGKDLLAAEFDRYEVERNENGDYRPLMIIEHEESPRGGIAFPVSRDTSGIVSKTFIEDRRATLEQGDYEESFWPPPAVIYDESLGREFIMSDAEPLDAVSTMVHFLENSEDSTTYLESNGDFPYTVIDYGEETYRAPLSVWLSSAPLKDEVKMDSSISQQNSSPGYVN